MTKRKTEKEKTEYDNEEHVLVGRLDMVAKWPWCYYLLLFFALHTTYVLYNGTVSVRLSLCLSQHGPTAANQLLIMRAVPRCQRT